MSARTSYAAAAAILLAVGSANADTVKFTHGSTLGGTVQSLTIRTAGGQKRLERDTLASVVLGPGGDVVKTVEGKEIRGQLVSVEIKTIGGTQSFARAKLLAVSVSGSAPGDGPVAAKPQYADKLTLTISHATVAEVMQAEIRVGGISRNVLRSKMAAVKLNRRTLDAIELVDGEKLVGRVQLLRARLGPGVVDFQRSELADVTLALASDDNRGPISDRPRLTSAQTDALVLSTSLRDKHLRDVAGVRTEAAKGVEANYADELNRVDRKMQFIEGGLKALQRAANLTKANLDTARRELENSRKQQIFWREQVVNRLQAKYDREAAIYREAAARHTAAKAERAALQKSLATDKRVFDKWAAGENAALQRVAAKNAFLTQDGAPLTAEQMSKAYEAVRAQAPVMPDARTARG